MDVNTRIKIGSMLSNIRNCHKEIESLKEDSEYELKEVNKILMENGESPVTIEEIIKSDEIIQRRGVRYKRF